MIDGLPLVDLGASAVLMLVVLMVLTGRLVPRRNLEDVCQERDHWRQAAEQRSDQLTQALEASEVATRALDALSAAAQRQARP